MLKDTTNSTMWLKAKNPVRSSQSIMFYCSSVGTPERYFPQKCIVIFDEPNSSIIFVLGPESFWKRYVLKVISHATHVSFSYQTKTSFSKIFFACLKDKVTERMREGLRERETKRRDRCGRNREREREKVAEKENLPPTGLLPRWTQAWARPEFLQVSRAGQELKHLDHISTCALILSHPFQCSSWILFNRQNIQDYRHKTHSCICVCVCVCVCMQYHWTAHSKMFKMANFCHAHLIVSLY